MAWLGRKKLAFIPLSRTNNVPPDVIPTDWAEQITRRVFFDKDPKTGTDRSLRAYIHTVSSGLADLDLVVQLPETITETPVGQSIAPDALAATKGDLLRAEGFDGAAIVMLGGPGGGETVGYWSRFTMSDDLGHWVGELVHQSGLCNLPDLFDFTDEFPAENMLGFDQEAGYLATHFSAWTKRAIGWLDPSTVALHAGQVTVYTLHSISLIQPPPAGRVAAVQIGQQVPYLMVEARLRADQFDFNIPSEGVIVYQVQTTDPLGNAQNSVPPLNLLTKTALAVGQSFTAVNGVIVQVNSSVPGGFSISVNVPDPNAGPWTSVSQGSSTPGAAITAVAMSSGQIALFLADPNGGVYTASGSPDSGWGPWSSVSQGSTTPGAPITAVVTGSNQIALFLADPNGGVYTASGSPNGAWGPWGSVSQGSSTPGGRITAVLTGSNQITLFLADPNGGVYTASGSAKSGWGPWSSVSQGSTTPGGRISAVVTSSGQIALFLADPNGGVYTASGSPGSGWGPWGSVSQGSSTPGAQITAVVTGSNQIALFLADPNGGVYTASGSPGSGWGPWGSVSQGSSTPGAQITAVVTGSNQIALFLADPNGGVYTTSGSPNGAWGPWRSVSQGSSTPGAPITAVMAGSNQIALFLADPNGGVYTAIDKF